MDGSASVRQRTDDKGWGTERRSNLRPPFSVPRRVSVQAFLIGLAALALYIPTLAPTVLWNGGDFAEFQTRAARLEIVPTVWGHPLWVILVHPFTRLPIGDSPIGLTWPPR